MAVYAVSDLHGQFNTFLAGLEMIGFGPEDTLYVIGDAIDRGPDGAALLEYIRANDNMDLIIGNHEFLMLNSVSSVVADDCTGRDSFLWLYGNGGVSTFEQFSALPDDSRRDLLDWMFERYVIKTVTVGDNRFCLTHSYYDKRFENKRYSQIDYHDVFDIVWKSMYRDGDDTNCDDVYSAEEYIFVTGHVPVQRVRKFFEFEEDFNKLSLFRKNNFIDIDGGCAFGRVFDLNNGALFLRLDDLEEFAVPLVD